MFCGTITVTEKNSSNAHNNYNSLFTLVIMLKVFTYFVRYAVYFRSANWPYKKTLFSCPCPLTSCWCWPDHKNAVGMLKKKKCDIHPVSTQWTNKMLAANNVTEREKWETFPIIIIACDSHSMRSPQSVDQLCESASYDFWLFSISKVHYLVYRISCARRWK